jgi:hypothetical protein
VRELLIRPASREAAALRASVLIIRCDDEETVRAPLDAFFGSGPGLNVYRGLPLEVDADGTLRSRWPMPFQRTIELQLEGGTARAQVRVAARPWGPDSLHFFARWHAPDDMPTRAHDWDLVTIAGEGLYVGTTLDVRYFDHSWWGEGDEKIWVDDERFPGWFGTGTEDYYGFAWCSNRLFAHAYHAQTRADGPVRDEVGASDSFGYSSMNRFHVVDAIPFRRRLSFQQEVVDWHQQSHIILDAVAYYYARPGARNNLPQVDAARARVP